MPGIWWMPIQTRTEMLSTGIRAPLGIKVFGDDLAHHRARVGRRSSARWRRSPARAARSPTVSTGGFYLDVVTDRERAARYGLRVARHQRRGDVGRGRHRDLGDGRGARALSDLGALRRATSATVPQALGDVLVATPAGAQVPLRQVADIRFDTGPPMIRSEDGRLVGYVFVDPGDRPVADYVAEGRRVVAERVGFRPGVRLEWAGQFTYFERAKARLRILVPVTLALVVLLLYLNTKSLVETGIVLLAVPFSLIGAVWLLWLLDYNLSVAVWVGLIALAGLDAETGVIMLLYLTPAPGASAAMPAASRPSPTCAMRSSTARRGACAEADDRAHHHDRAGADPVVDRRRGRRDEADRGADGRRAGHLVPARAHRLSGDLRAVEGKRMRRAGWASRRNA